MIKSSRIFADMVVLSESESESESNSNSESERARESERQREREMVVFLGQLLTYGQICIQMIHTV